MGMKYKIHYELDSPERTLHHKELIKSKLFLRKLYEEWCGEIMKELKSLPGINRQMSIFQLIKIRKTE